MNIGVGSLMKILRNLYGESLDDLAKACNTTRQNIHKIEVSKAHSPKLDIALSIAQHYNMTLDDFAHAATILHYHGHADDLKAEIRRSAVYAMRHFFETFDAPLDDVMENDVKDGGV